MCGNKSKYGHGFTLIELMITIAIISILAAIALPVYLDRAATSANAACMAELKAYANTVIHAYSHKTAPVEAPRPSACISITNASLSAKNTLTSLNGFPVNPGSTGTTCLLSPNVGCDYNAALTPPP